MEKIMKALRNLILIISSLIAFSAIAGADTQDLVPPSESPIPMK